MLEGNPYPAETENSRLRGSRYATGGSLQMWESLGYENRFVEANPKTTNVEFAKALQVSPLTVGRWPCGGEVPEKKHYVSSSEVCT